MAGEQLDMQTDQAASLEAEVQRALGNVYDPEIPSLSVLDLGMVDAVECTADGAVTVRMMPTFMGCPALVIIENNVKRALSQVAGVKTVEVSFIHDTPWTSERITETGRERLREFGISPPKCSLLAMKQLEAACPYCGSEHTRLDNLFGPDCLPCHLLLRRLPAAV